MKGISMNKKRMIILIILCIFTVGMIMGAASASHTFHKGKYKLTVSNNQYKKLKKTDQYMVSKKVGTVKKTKWVTKKMKIYETWLDSNGNLIKSKSWNPYNKFGYKAKYVKSITKYYVDGEITWGYYKVPKKVKKPVYMAAIHDSRYGDHKIHVEIYDFNPK